MVMINKGMSRKVVTKIIEVIWVDEDYFYHGSIVKIEITGSGRTLGWVTIKSNFRSTWMLNRSFE